MPWESKIDLDRLVAVDVHVHAGVSAAAPRPSSDGGPRPTGVRGIQERIGAGHQTPDETAAYYRERRIAAVIWGVDPQGTNGVRPGAVGNDELLEAACRNNDVLIPFVMVDPWRGRAGALEAERLIAAGAQGFKFHPPEQGLFANDRRIYEIYEVLNAHRVPALFHTGQTAVGQGARGGGGIRLKFGSPLPLDDVAVDFPDMPIVMAHPSVPWQDEALSIAVHKPQVYIDLSGWSPKCFPPILVQYANTLLKDKIMFGSDYPVMAPEKWMEEFEKLPIKPEVRPLILKKNAARLLGLS